MKRNFYDFDETLAIQNHVVFYQTLKNKGPKEQAFVLSIQESEPLQALERMIRQYRNGEKVYVLTARSPHHSSKVGIQMFLKKWGINIPLSQIFMVGGTGEAKSAVIEQFISDSTNIEFHDDVLENISAVESLSVKYPHKPITTFWIQ
jgi:hypothetical protein